MKVLITNRIPEEIIKKYEENFELDYNDSLDFLSKEELKARIKDAQALVCPLSEKNRFRNYRRSEKFENNCKLRRWF